MSNDERVLRQWVQDWMSASKARNTEKVLGMMSDDVVFMVPGKAPFGKKEFAESSHAMKDIQIDGKVTTIEVEVLGDWAWMRNHLRITITPPAGAPMVRSGYTLTIMKKDSSGKWLITRDANLLTSELVEG
jgi:uncharacterized protein (TIGR02246 family)